MAARLPSIGSLTAARRILAGRPERKIGHNTWLIAAPDGSIAVRYHRTDVVTYRPESSAVLQHVVLHSGGWMTPTTKHRLNQCSPASVFSDRGLWVVTYGDSEATWRDGMILLPAVPCSPCKGPDCLTCGGTGALMAIEGGGPARETLNALRRECRDYARAYVRALAAGEIPSPSGADCWGCLMAKPRGAQADTTHPCPYVADHMREQYYVPTLAISACQAFGVSRAAMAWVLGQYHSKHIPVSAELGGICAAQVRKAIARYCQWAVGLPR